MGNRTIHRFPWGSGEDAQVWIVHYGSKSTPLIAQLCREIGLRSNVVSWQSFPDLWRVRNYTPKLVILSGGEQSVTDEGAPGMPSDVFAAITSLSCVLGICYGGQLLAQLSGGEVRRADQAEYGEVAVHSRGFGAYQGGNVVMNHRDEITRLPGGWENVGSSERCRHAFVGLGSIWAIQFHPEMDHTENGDAILKHIAFDIAGCAADYAFDPATFVREASLWMGKACPSDLALCGLSGGVDSSVAFALARSAYEPKNLHALFVDTGWYREGELEEVRGIFGTEQVSYVDASNRFYDAIETIRYPETESLTTREYLYYDNVRNTIGRNFITVFLAEAQRMGRTPKALIQGTNAADIIESETGLKSHHNVGGLPDQLDVDVIEPLAGLYKFEIRELAAYLGLPEEIVHRQPFPGPGLAIRAWGKLSREDAPPLRTANRILEEVVRKHYPDHKDRPCQYYVALAKLPSTGLMGDDRVIGYLWWIRMVTSRRRESYATLGVFEGSKAFKDELAHRLTAEVSMPDGTRFVRVGIEITGKPPSTTEPH